MAGGASRQPPLPPVEWSEREADLALSFFREGHDSLKLPADDELGSRK